MDKVGLTAGQLAEALEFAGLTVDRPDDQSLLDTEITIIESSKRPINDTDAHGVTHVKYYPYVAYLTEYFEEGCMPLGEEIMRPPSGQGQNWDDVRGKGELSEGFYKVKFNGKWAVLYFSGERWYNHTSGDYSTYDLLEDISEIGEKIDLP